MYMYEFTNIIYIYLFVIICLIGFNVWYVYHEKVNEKIGEKKKKKYHKIILEEMEDNELTKKKERYFYHQLKNVNKFIWFDAVLTDLRQEAKENEEIDVDAFILKLTPVFQKLAVYYRGRESIEKAFFAHVLANYPNMSNNSSDRIFKNLMEFTHDDSIYCRENAMTYFYRNGNVENIIHALKSINDNNLFYSQKLLTDDLLKFSGNKNDLAKALLDTFDQLNIEMQISIINFLRLLKDGYEKEIYNLFEKHKYDKEVELAMIRYFARHTYEKITTDLIKIMENLDEENTEYRIITASTLSSYDTKKVRLVLITSLSDVNWYVRKNSATSLAHMNLTKDEMKLIENNKDHYACEMISYVWHDLGKEININLNSKEEKNTKKKGKKKHVSVH